MVITNGCDEGGVGTERWLVHPGGDGGFGDPISWGLPDYGVLPLSTEAVSATAGEVACGSTMRFRYSTADFTGDAIPDLVVTDASDEGGVGTERWLVHPADADGFGDPITWALPNLDALELEFDDTMPRTAGERRCPGDGDFTFTAADITGDGLVDLVVTDACDEGGVGEDRWLVHPGLGDGFGDVRTWPLPDYSALPGNEKLDALVAEQACEGESFRFSAVDLDGDGLLDLAVTDACDDAGVGTERWLLHPAACE